MFERDDKTERFFVDGQPGDDGVVAGGFRWLAAYSREHAHTEGALVVPQLRSLDNVARVIGVAVAKRLAKTRRVAFGDVALQLFTENKSPWSYEGPILAVWTRDKSLEKLDTTGAAAICAAPWSPENIAAWKENWNPIDVLSGNPGGATETVGNPVVAKALEWLTTTVNVGTGLSDPSDRASAIHMFRMLRDGQETYRSGEIRAWAVRHGWRPEDARELADVAQKILDRRPLRAGSEGRWREDALEQLRREAGETDSS